MTEGWVMRCIGSMDQLLVLVEMFLRRDAIDDFLISTRLLTLIYFLLPSIFFLLDGHIEHFVLFIILAKHCVTGEVLWILLMHVLMWGWLAVYGIALVLTVWPVFIHMSVLIVKVFTFIARIIIHLNRLLAWYRHQFETWLVNRLREARLLLHHAWVTFVRVAIVAERDRTCLVEEERTRSLLAALLGRLLTFTSNITCLVCVRAWFEFALSAAALRSQELWMWFRLAFVFTSGKGPYALRAHILCH